MSAISFFRRVRRAAPAVASFARAAAGTAQAALVILEKVSETAEAIEGIASRRPDAMKVRLVKNPKTGVFEVEPG